MAVSAALRSVRVARSSIPGCFFAPRGFGAGVRVTATRLRMGRRGDVVRTAFVTRRRVVRRGLAALRADERVRFVMPRAVLRRAFVIRFFFDAIDPPSFTRRQNRRP